MAPEFRTMFTLLQPSCLTPENQTSPTSFKSKDKISQDIRNRIHQSPTTASPDTQAKPSSIAKACAITLSSGNWIVDLKNIMQIFLNLFSKTPKSTDQNEQLIKGNQLQPKVTETEVEPEVINTADKKQKYEKIKNEMVVVIKSKNENFTEENLTDHELIIKFSEHIEKNKENQDIILKFIETLPQSNENEELHRYRNFYISRKIPQDPQQISQDPYDKILNGDNNDETHYPQELTKEDDEILQAEKDASNREIYEKAKNNLLDAIKKINPKYVYISDQFLVNAGKRLTENEENIELLKNFSEVVQYNPKSFKQFN